jgi:hypothetical protein
MATKFNNLKVTLAGWWYTIKVWPGDGIDGRFAWHEVLRRVVFIPLLAVFGLLTVAAAYGAYGRDEAKYVFDELFQ